MDIVLSYRTVPEYNEIRKKSDLTSMSWTIEYQHHLNAITVYYVSSRPLRSPTTGREFRNLVRRLDHFGKYTHTSSATKILSLRFTLVTSCTCAGYVEIYKKFTKVTLSHI